MLERARSMVLWLRNRFRRVPVRQRSHLALTDKGFDVFATKELEVVRSVSWEEVRGVWAFKRDVFSYDLICLEFLLADGVRIEIDEDLKGYRDVVNRMMEVFPEIRLDWWQVVAYPPFATNLVQLFPNDECTGIPRAER